MPTTLVKFGPVAVGLFGVTLEAYRYHSDYPPFLYMALLMWGISSVVWVAFGGKGKFVQAISVLTVCYLLFALLTWSTLIHEIYLVNKFLSQVMLIWFIGIFLRGTRGLSKTYSSDLW